MDRRKIDLQAAFGREVVGVKQPFDSGFCFSTFDGSLLEKETGEFVYVHTNDFIEEIVFGDRCPFCFCQSSVNAFNAEHIFPEWVLRFTGIWEKNITLPNGRDVPYSRYKVRCCADCNSRMSGLYEAVVSKAVKSGYSATRELLHESPELVYQWLCLVFYKVHLKDLEYRHFPDLRKPNVQIGHFFNWGALHHVFCVARSRIFGYSIMPDAIGSIALLRYHDEAESSAFDYHDHWVTRVVYLRIGEVAFIASLSDAGATSHMLEDAIAEYPEPCDEGAVRCMLGEFMAAKLHIESDPQFKSLVSEDLRVIIADRSPVTWAEKKKTISGFAHAWAYPELFGKYRKDGLSIAETCARILTGDLIFSSGDRFIRDEQTLDAAALFDSHRAAFPEVNAALLRHANGLKT